MAESRAEKAATEYVVLVSYDEDTQVERPETEALWTLHSRHTGTGDNAKRAAIKGDDALASQVAKGVAWLVAIPARSWRPKRAGVKPRDPVLEV